MTRFLSISISKISALKRRQKKAFVRTVNHSNRSRLQSALGGGWDGEDVTVRHRAAAAATIIVIVIVCVMCVCICVCLCVGARAGSI